MRITGIESHVLMDPGFDPTATSSAQDTFIVEVSTDEGVAGIGETDLSPVIAKACLEAYGSHTMARGLTEMLLGRDPLQVEAIWEDLYVGSAMNGRRGAVVHTLGAIDLALHDIRGKVEGRPCHELLGDRRDSPVVPYASLQPEVSDFDEYIAAIRDWAVQASENGFTAAKLEITPTGPYAHRGMKADYSRMVEPIAAVRAGVGTDFVIMVDVQYAFPDADTCLRAIESWQDHDVFFIETPLPSDDLAGYARLAAEQPIPVAAGEWLATRFEFRELMDAGRVAVAQPDVARVGGLTETMRVCDDARERGIRIVPHAWKTGVTVTAAAHMAAVTPHCPFIEYLPPELCESRLRAELVEGGAQMEGGEIRLSDQPGLGIELNQAAFAEFKETADRFLSQQ